MGGMSRILLALALFAAPFGLAQAQNPAAKDQGVLGNWREPGGSVIRIGPCGGFICATLAVVKPPASYDGNNPDPALRTRKLCGLAIGYGFHLTDPAHADGGQLYDPKTGKTYRGDMTSQGDTLKLRGYVGIRAFGRTEVWTRVSAPSQGCS